MNTKNLIAQFNMPDTHLVISAWPDRWHGKKSYHGDAAFARETLVTLVNRHNMRFVVIAETNLDNRPQLVAGGKILVLRVIDHGKFHLYPTVLTWLAKFPAIRHVTVHSNFTYSGLKHFILLIPFLGLIKLTGRNITHVAHNVVDSIDFLAKQLDTTNTVLVAILNMCIRVYNVLLGIVTDKLVTLDAHGYAILSKYVPGKKLLYNPHWVKPRSTHWTKRGAKTALGLKPDTKVILAFGFISWYKGSDKLAKAFTQAAGKNQEFHLIFAGGKSPSMEHKIHYQQFYGQFTQLISKHTNMTLTGFIPDSQIGKYFAAADLVILPYRGLMGGSGALAFAVGFKKPFLLSTAMNTIWENHDMRVALKKAGLKNKQVMIPITAKGVKRALNTASNTPMLKKLRALTNLLGESRHIDTVTDQLYNESYASHEVVGIGSGVTYAPTNVTA